MTSSPRAAVVFALAFSLGGCSAMAPKPDQELTEAIHALAKDFLERRAQTWEMGLSNAGELRLFEASTATLPMVVAASGSNSIVVKRLSIGGAATTVEVSRTVGGDVAGPVQGRWYFPRCVRPAPGATPGPIAKVIFLEPGLYEVGLCVGEVCPQTIGPLASPCIFSDGFETGDARLWTSSVGGT
jgi:hypothetical protein